MGLGADRIMVLFLFTRNILADQPIDIFNYGNHKRDFTYVDDSVEDIVRTPDKLSVAKSYIASLYKLYFVINL